MLDCLIAGASVVDGTGNPAFQAEVGIRDGRIAVVGRTEEPSRRRIDAHGLVVAPGFVDIHTHYDAQVFWEPELSPSLLHGVTTVIGGNCGFTIAPVNAESADYLMEMLAWVEGMPLASLRTGVPWGSWGSVGEWLDLLEGQLCLNAGFLAGHSALRRVAMGERAVGPAPPTEADMAVMESLLCNSLEAGALGFSSSNGVSHLDGDGQPVPSRWASDQELVALAGVLRRYQGTSLEYVPTDAATEAERMAAMSSAAGKALNWNLLAVDAARQLRNESELAASDLASARGARVLALSVPMVLRVRRNFAGGFGLATFPDWGPIFDLPEDERIAALRRSDVRDKLRQGATRAPARVARFVDFGAYVIEQSPGAAPEGARISDLAAAEGSDPFDVLLDVVVKDRLQTILLAPPIGDDETSWRLRTQIWQDPRVVLGGSDAGAHLDVLDAFLYCTELLGDSVRKHRRIPLEQAVHLLTDQPARLYGLRGRGQVREGWMADLVVFDPETVEPEPVTTRFDLPGERAASTPVRLACIMCSSMGSRWQPATPQRGRGPERCCELDETPNERLGSQIRSAQQGLGSALNRPLVGKTALVTGATRVDRACHRRRYGRSRRACCGEWS